MRVTLVHASSLLNLRGSEIWLIDVSNLLKSASVSVRVINFDYDRRYPRNEEEIRRRDRIIREAFGTIPLVRLSALRLRPPFRVGKTLARFVETYLHFIPLSRSFLASLHDSDVIYYVLSQRSPSYLIVVLLAATLAGRKPVIAGVHVRPGITGFELALLKIFVRIGVLEGVHLVNRTHESEFKKVGCRHVEYIPNGIYYERFYSGGHGTKDSQKVFSILFVGAMTNAKGADLLPEIYVSLKKHGLEFTLSVCTSGGELTDKIKNWSNDKPDVMFKGFVERDNLARLYKLSSVALFPSRREGFPIACLEAQASGTPVVVSDIPGFRQAVIDQGTGFFASSYGPDSFADGIIKIHELWKWHREKYLAMCLRSEANVGENFQWKHVLKRLTDLFSMVLN